MLPGPAIRNGSEMGTLTISRFFVAHIFLIPACIFALVASLIRIKAKFSADQLAELFKHSSAKMTAGGMPPIDLPPDDLKALIAYAESLK